MLVCVLAVAAALRLYALDVESLWLDETFSLDLARGSWRYLFTEAADDFHPPLYFVLLKLWCGLAGHSGWSARLFSVVVSVGGVGAAYAAGTRLVSPAVGLAAAGLLALSPFQVEYAQEARMYGLLALVATWSTLAFRELVPDSGAMDRKVPRRTSLLTRAWWMYVAASTCLVYTHAVGFFILLAHGLLAAWIRVRRPDTARAVERWITAILAVGLAFLPWLPTFALQFTTVQRGFWIGNPEPTDLARTVQAFAGSPRLAAVLFGLVVAGAFTVAGVRKGRGEGWSTRVLILAWSAVPIVAPFLASLVGAPIFLPKYTIAASVPFAVLAACGIMGLPRPLAAATSVVLLALSVQPLGALYATQQKDDWRGAVRDIEGTASADATVLLYPYFTDYPWRIYAERSDLTVRRFPRHAADTTTPTLTHLFDELAPHQSETWLLVIGYDPRRDTLVAHLAERYGNVERRARGHVDVYRATRPRLRRQDAELPSTLFANPVVR